MRRILFLLPTLLAVSVLFGQQTEFGLSLNSGLFSFAGPSTASSTTMITGANSMLAAPKSSNYTNSPYGSKAAWCDGLSAELLRISRRHILTGVSLGYEALRSDVSLTAVSVVSGFLAYEVPAHGHTDLTSQFINLSPSIGYRLTPGNLDLDLTGGLDFAYCLSASESGKAYAANGIIYTGYRDRKTIPADIRPRLQVSVRMHRIAVYAGYSYGLVNYMSGYIGGRSGAYARLMRFGLQYWLK